MKLSIAITVHNEVEYLNQLMKVLLRFVDETKDENSYEIVVVDDFSDEPIPTMLDVASAFPFVSIHQHALNGDFAAHKNFLNSKCTGDFILQLDADEMITPELIAWIPDLIAANPTVDAYWIPRLNTVDGLTDDHIRKWGWSDKVDPYEPMVSTRTPVSQAEIDFLRKNNLLVGVEMKNVGSLVEWKRVRAISCWPDPQMRLYRNSPDIKWKFKVHEVLTGFKKFGTFPVEHEFAIQHHKTVERQEAQNEFYATMQR